MIFESSGTCNGGDLKAILLVPGCAWDHRNPLDILDAVHSESFISLYLKEPWEAPSEFTSLDCMSESTVTALKSHSPLEAIYFENDLAV